MSSTKKPESQAIQTAQNNAPAELKLSDAKLKEWLKNTGKAQNMSDGDVSLFLDICKASGLNPFKREIHASKYSKDGELSIVVGYEVYIDRANKSGLLNGWKIETSGKASDKTLKATLTINRKDWDEPFIWEAWYYENVGKKRDGSITKFWSTRPAFMIKKVCISQGFRLCFTDILGGMPYTREEMNTGEDAYIMEDQASGRDEPIQDAELVEEPKKADPAPEKKVEEKKEPKKDPDATEEQLKQLQALLEHPYFDGVNKDGDNRRDATSSRISEGLSKDQASKYIDQITKLTAQHDAENGDIPF